MNKMTTKQARVDSLRQDDGQNMKDLINELKKVRGEEKPIR